MLHYFCASCTSDLGLGTCPDNSWTQFQKNCYKIHMKMGTFEDAQKECQRSDSNLVTIESAEENLFIRNFSNATELKLWIGLQDTIGDNNITSYQWLNNSEYLDLADYQNWQNGYPVEAEYRCVYFTKSGWHNLPCSNKLSFICEPG